MAMGFVVGGWLASTVISKLIDYAKDQKVPLGLKDELVAQLENGLPNIQELVKTVDQGLIREEDPALEQWLWQLRDAADQADDVMDEIKYNYEKEKVMAAKNKFNKRWSVEAEENNVNKRLKVNDITNNFSTIFLGAVDEGPFLKRLKKAVKAIDEVAKDVGLFSMLVQNLVTHQKKKVKLAISSRETTSFLNLQNHVFGRQEEKDDIIKKLVNLNCKTKMENLTILPIIGVGGVGKTTLVQLVYNDPIVEKHFDLRLWVCISNNFDVVLLTKKLYESAFGQRADLDSFDLIQEKLQEKLESRRFLVVFDDVWNDNNKDDWEKLIAPLKNGKNGSMMLLTTRMKSVATLTGPNLLDSIILEGLSECDMWDLFKECAFGGKDPNNHKELVEIGKYIVKRLEGIPLVAKTIGGILFSNLDVDHWTGILDSELWNLKKKQDDIMPALKLTYQYLPPHLKPCFSFCSIFPQDHVFSKNDLINMWIALGMVPPGVNAAMRPEDVGSKYFDDLISKSIFICPNNVSLKKNEFVMHDLIHDLSVLVSQGECLRTSTNKPVSVPNTVRHLFAHFEGPSELSTYGLKNLHTLILQFHGFHHPKLDSVVTEMLRGMKSLRVLILVDCDLGEFPESISKLLHLRYLSLNSCKISAFPKSMSQLYLLETMVYDNFGIEVYGQDYQIKQADVLGKLINLRHLIAPEWLLDNAGMGRLTLLQKLAFRVGKDSGIKISELSNMRELRSLRINRMENVGSREEVIKANLRNKVNLIDLCLSWTEPHRMWTRIEPNKQHNEDVLDHFQPHSSLKELTIRFYEGTGRPPIWFGRQTLSKLVRLQIQSCNFVDLPCLEELPLLKFIDFRDLYAIERIIHECNLSPTLDAFPSLEGLSVNGMRAIKAWCMEKQPTKWMQCLRKLNVRGCPKLQILPPVPVGVKELRFKHLGLYTLPSLWNDESSKSGSLAAFVVISIIHCDNLVSLSHGLLQNPEQFVALEKLKIKYCEKLINLPPGGFSRFISLKELSIHFCSKIDRLLVQQECFLPSELQKLSICSCGHLDTTFSKAVESVHSLVELELSFCENMTSLPSKEVFSKWKTLKRLCLQFCTVLTSLESLFGLSSIEYLKIRGCPKLSPAQPQPPSPSMETGNTSAQESSLLSVDELLIDDPLLLSVEPIRSLPAVRKGTIENCYDLQSLPELPPFQEISIRYGRSVDEEQAMLYTSRNHDLLKRSALEMEEGDIKQYLLD